MVFKPLYCMYGKYTIAQRHVLMIMLGLALVNAYHLRVVLNIAIHEMIVPKNASAATHDACPDFTYEKLDVKGGTYDWPNWLEAFILYAFYIGYVFSQLPGGWLADKIGARHVLGTCMVISIISNVLLPFSVQKGGHVAAIVLRAILGIAQGPIYPTISSFLQKWTLVTERGFIGGIAYGGSPLGAFTGNILTGVMIKGTSSWPMAFYMWGLVALIWYIFYLFMVFSEPDTHPFISPEEYKYLKEGLSQGKKKKFAVPWLELFKSPAIYAILFAQYCHNYVYFTMVTVLPKYMKDILKMNIQSNAVFSSMPFFALWVTSVIFARLAYFALKRGWCKVVTLRKIYTGLGCLCPSTCMLLAAYIGCNRGGAIALYIVGLSLVSFFYIGTFVNINDITQNYSGIIMAIVNGIASTAGVLGPWVVGHLTPRKALSEWRTVFWIMFGISAVSCTVFVLFARGERQKWDFPEITEDDEDESAPKVAAKKE